MIKAKHTVKDMAPNDACRSISYVDGKPAKPWSTMKFNSIFEDI